MCDYKKFFEEEHSHFSAMLKSLEGYGIKFIDASEITFDSDPKKVDELSSKAYRIARLFHDISDALLYMQDEIEYANEQD